MTNFFTELKRRNIFRVGIAYLVLGWFILQVGAIVAPALNLPDWTLPFVIFFLSIGFPIALVFAWAFEMTPQGLKKTAEVGVTDSITNATGKRLNTAIIAVLCLTVLALLVDRFVIAPSRQPSADSVQTTDTEAGEASFDSIAVLPFVNMSGDSQQEYFSDGISEELLNLLAKRKDLRVAARTSSFAFKGQNQDIKEIGNKLNVDTVLEGSVRKSGTKLRITAQLIETGTGYHLWSETYDRELDDVFAIQDEISAAIVGALRLHLGEEAGEPTKSQVTNLDAYNAYLKGRHNVQSRQKDKLYEALVNFEKANLLDPNYAPAYSGKADAFMLLSDNFSSYGDIPDEYALKLAEPIIARALEIDPNLAEAYTSNGLLLQNQDKPEEALASLNRAIELAPNLSRAYHWRALAYLELGDRNRALEDFEMAHTLDPFSLPPLVSALGNYVSMGNVEAAEKLQSQIDQLVEKDGRFQRGEIFLHWTKGQHADAYLTAERIEKASPGEARFIQTFLAFQLKNKQKVMELAPIPLIKVFAHLAFGNAAAASTILDELAKNGPLEDYEIHLIRLEIAIRTEDAEARDQALTALADVDDSINGPLFDSDPDDIDLGTLIHARMLAGDEEGAARLADSMREYIASVGPKGYELDLMDEEIGLLTYEGKLDEAMALLRKMEQSNSLHWFMRNNLPLSPLANREDFQAIFANLDEHINQERAKLGWPPAE